MTRRKKIATACFAINAFAFLMIGLTFVLKQSFFPFHADVIQTSWADVDPAAQTLYLGMMRTEGAGYLASAVAIGFLLLIPFRRHELWSYWAIATIGIVEHLPTLFANLHVSQTTPASPPWPFVLLGIVLLAIGLVVSIAENRQPEPVNSSR